MSGGSAAAKKPKRQKSKSAVKEASGNSVTAPMQGTVVKVAVVEGAEVAEGDLVVVLEAMKMEQPINAHRSGVIKGLAVEAGQSVQSGEVLCEIVDVD